MRLYNINRGLIDTIRGLCCGATGAVCYGGSSGGWFRAAVGVGQGCLFLPTLFGTFLERVMADALGDHRSTVSIGGRTVSDLHFAGDVEAW